MAFQGRFRVPGALQRHLRHSRDISGHYRDIPGVLQGCSRGVPGCCRGILEAFREASQRYSKGIP